MNTVLKRLISSLLLLLIVVSGFASAEATVAKSNNSDTETLLRNRIKEIVSECTNSSMSEYQKALNLYDWILLNVQYDYQYEDTGIQSGEYSPASAEGPLLSGWGYASGVHYAYYRLLREAGIYASPIRSFDTWFDKYYFLDSENETSTRFTISAEPGCEWLVARIDGRYYHFRIDLDFYEGGKRHGYFAIPDEVMGFNHESWYDVQYLCNSVEANYHYVNGTYDDALELLKSEINARLEAGTYEDTFELSYEQSAFDKIRTPPSASNPVVEAPERVFVLLAAFLKNDSAWNEQGKIDITLEYWRKHCMYIRILSG